MTKHYLALVAGQMQEGQVVEVDAPIGCSSRTESLYHIHPEVSGQTVVMH